MTLSYFNRRNHMKNGNIFNEGTAAVSGALCRIGDIGWNPHPTFKGVSMKHVVKGADTDGRLSCHLVRIEPGCEIGDHVHEGKMELHEVVAGRGFCVIGDETVDYAAGSMAYIPDDVRHSVKAGTEGLEILAKFCPALI